MSCFLFLKMIIYSGNMCTMQVQKTVNNRIIKFEMLLCCKKKNHLGARWKI